MATRGLERRKNTTVTRALRNSASVGLILGTVVVVALLVLGHSDVDVAVWGTTLIVGFIGTAAGLVFAGMTRAIGRGEQRALGRDHVEDHFLPAAVGLERSFLYVGVPALVTFLMLSASLVLQGERLF